MKNRSRSAGTREKRSLRSDLERCSEQVDAGEAGGGDRTEGRGCGCSSMGICSGRRGGRTSTLRTATPGGHSQGVQFGSVNLGRLPGEVEGESLVTSPSGVRGEVGVAVAQGGGVSDTLIRLLRVSKLSTEPLCVSRRLVLRVTACGTLVETRGLLRGGRDSWEDGAGEITAETLGLGIVGNGGVGLL